MRDGPVQSADIGPLAERADDIDVRGILSRLRRRKWTILGTTLLLSTLLSLIVLQITPRYRAEAQVMIDTRHNRVVKVDEVLSGLTGDRETIESERRVIASRALAEKAVSRLDLARHPEFNPDLRPPHPLLALLDPATYFGRDGESEPGLWRAIADLLGSVARPERTHADGTNEGGTARVIDAFQDRLEVLPDGRSRVLTITFQSEKPALAAAVVNTLAELYLADQLEAKYEAARAATEWLTDRTAEMREKVKAAEDAVELFRRQAGLLEGKGGTITSQQAAELNTQLILARGQRAEAEARLRQVQAVLSEEAGAESVAQVLSSPTIVRLKDQEAEVTRRLAEHATQYGPKHPRMINVQAELADIRGKVQAEVQKVVYSLRNEANVARAREASLNAGLEALKGSVGRANTAEVQLRALEREAAANRALFENFLMRLKETTAQQDLQRPDGRLISRADIPDRPSFPRTKPMLLAIVLLSAVAGLAVAFALDRLDIGIRSTGQIESVLGVPGLGLVPLLGRLRRRRRPERYVVDKPGSAFAEALRTLHTALCFSDVVQPPRSVLITSSLPREGKSTIALGWARLMARGGRKILLVDADLRHPRVAAALTLAQGPGLAEVLAGELPWRDAVQQDRTTNLDVLVAGRSALSPPDLFGSPMLRELLAGAEVEYDLIIFDSPPVLPVAEARILAALVDKTVFVVRWGQTPRDAASLALKHLRDSGAGIAGAVLSMVDTRQHARYGYPDSGVYYGASRSYYTN